MTVQSLPVVCFACRPNPQARPVAGLPSCRTCGGRGAVSAEAWLAAAREKRP